MKKAIVRYREDMDLENIIDFVQKKVFILFFYSDCITNALRFCI